jgi:hypothetical protein
MFFLSEVHLLSFEQSSGGHWAREKGQLNTKAWGKLVWEVPPSLTCPSTSSVHELPKYTTYILETFDQMSHTG